MSCPPQHSFGFTTKDLALNSAVINKATVNQLTACDIKTKNLVANDARIAILNNAQLDLAVASISGREVVPAFIFNSNVSSASINEGFIIGQFGTYSTRFVLADALPPGGQIVIGTVNPELLPFVQATEIIVTRTPFSIIAFTIFPDGTVDLTDLAGSGAAAGSVLELSDTHQVSH